LFQLYYVGASVGDAVKMSPENGENQNFNSM